MHRDYHYRQTIVLDENELLFEDRSASWRKGMSLIQSQNNDADGYNFSPATVSFGTFLTLRKVQRITAIKNSSFLLRYLMTLFMDIFRNIKQLICAKLGLLK
ncbi:MAG: hypothetical protein IIA61_02945 [Candidatus Marinimicrobia bacterium]|nr:hypothetical protein [Candidatus Neomarinimicrobiota bacterium]